MKVLVACEYSGIVRDAFLAKGHDALSCDLLPTESPGPHYQGDIRDLIAEDPNWDLMVAHPTCTYLTNAGVRHLHENVTSKNGKRAAVYGAARFKAMEEGAAFFNWLASLDIPKIAIENPVPHKYAKAIIGNYTQLIRPWQFGNPENKAICLWLKNLSKLSPTNIIVEREHKVHLCPPSKDRGKIRSKFFPEVAAAMADQWG